MSKANQAFKQNDEAVSPVIGVILMVAITVVLAAVVFVLVSNLGKSSNSAPTFALSRDDSTDRLSVTSADSDADWNRIAVKTSSATLCFQANTQPTGACAGTDAFVADVPIVANTKTEVTGTAHVMGAGDFLGFCDTNAATAVTIQLIDTAANSVIGSYTYNDLAAC